MNFQPPIYRLTRTLVQNFRDMVALLTFKRLTFVVVQPRLQIFLRRQWRGVFRLLRAMFGVSGLYFSSCSLAGRIWTVVIQRKNEI
nr:hypothetical protein Iba_chr10cCG2770 [Ipomoea batatas]